MSAQEQVKTSSTRRRRRSQHASSSRAQRSRLRMVFFSLASLWGFLIGTVSLLVGVSLGGRSLNLSPVAIVTLSGATVLAVVGGLIASRAYLEATRRNR